VIDTRAGRRFLATAVVIQPLLVGVNATFHPEVELTGAGLVAGAAGNPTGWYILHMVAAVGALLIAPAILGLRILIDQRGRRVANLGVGVGFLAAMVLAIAFASEASALRLAVTAGLDEAGTLAIGNAFMQTPEAFGVPVGAAAFALSAVLMASALLAAGSVPRWQAILFLVGVVSTLAATPGSPVGPIAFGIVTIASAFLAGHVIRGTAGSAPNRTNKRPMAGAHTATGGHGASAMVAGGDL
jgi:hypothetical protein